MISLGVSPFFPIFRRSYPRFAQSIRWRYHRPQIGNQHQKDGEQVPGAMKESLVTGENLNLIFHGSLALMNYSIAQDLRLSRKPEQPLAAARKVATLCYLSRCSSHLRFGMQVWDIPIKYIAADANKIVGA